MRRIPTVVALLAIALCGAGCSLLAPIPTRTRFYSLSAIPAAGPSLESPTGDRRIVGLGPIKLPDYLNRSARAIRLGPNQVRFDDDERWAEPLDTNVARVLSQDLAVKLADTEVVTVPTFLGARRVFDVPVEILRFESTATGVAELHARWAIEDGQTGDILLIMETHLTEPATAATADAAVAALSRALDHCSEEIAAAVVRLQATRPPAPAVTVEQPPASRRTRKSSR